MARYTRACADRAGPVKPRQSHRKSRNGCDVCKRRHMKCDETRPTCLHCRVSHRQCVYTDAGSSSCLDASSPSTLSAHTSPGSTSILNTPGSKTSDEGDLGRRATVLNKSDLFDLEHMALFHHIQTHVRAIMIIDTAAESMATEVIDSALKSPYLMNQLLAISALHLSKGDSAQARYLQHATTLQTRALALFNEAREEVSEATCVPMFLFSSFLGVHVLCDTLQGTRENLGAFLDRFIRYLSIHRGVSAVTSQSWSMIKGSRLGASIQQIEDAFCADDYAKEETEILYRMVDESNLGSTSAETYQQAIKKLQQIFALHGRLMLQGRPCDAAITFCIIVNDDYIEHLKQRRPEALIILAFYGVILHWNRNIWIFGDGGQYLIQAITSHLGAYWARWLCWPNSVLQDELSDQNLANCPTLDESR
ncbi:hypothetical protein EDB80DRAFT_706405 [Ilyonectria destructans]|nr:hypothetical protein EDB80DRAFT_706405 [Ilyonectria destructans]